MSSGQPISLGPFDLSRIIGQGGMGEVWWGIHRAQRVPVAVKVITRAYARQEKYLAGFRHEVRAHAQLDHPGIVMVFDYGEIPSETAQASHGLLIEGSPYLVMEYAGHGTLSSVRGPLPWSELRGILLFLLDVLAHAHARGVIHRDLKPANILFAAPADIRPGPKLTDFGIAFALDAASQGHLAKGSLGSPAYMAPEQWFGDWRDYGPWTDLYGVGCIAYQLATGSRPFSGDDTLAIANAHMSAAPPRFSIQHPYPTGFEAWVGRLLQKLPRDRFQRASDAIMALDGLEDASEPAIPLAPSNPEFRATAKDIGPCLSGRPLKTISVLDDRDIPTEVMALTSLNLSEGGPNGSDWTPMDFPRCPVPAATVARSWKPRHSSAPSIRLVGAGLGLFGLRAIPLVDRQVELDTIWNALLAVHQTQKPRLIAIQGPSGHGKSRLTQWISERAHELGAAIVLKAAHSPILVPGAGLARMVARHWQCVGLGRQDVLTRIRRLLQEQGVADDYEWNALTELMITATEAQRAEGQGAIRFTSSTQRYALIRRMLERLAGERPIIIWMDDVQWGLDSIQFANYLVSEPTQAPLPVLLLLTVQEQALSLRPLEAEAFKALVQRELSSQLAVGPLDDRHQAELVRHLLFLEGELAEQVERRSGGNPLFAIQLIGDWIRRGVLEVGQRGFALKTGEKALLPDGIHAMWTASLDRMLDEYAEARCSRGQMLVDLSTRQAGKAATRVWLKADVQRILEVAAALGQVVDKVEWQQTLELLGLPLPFDLADALIRNRLVFPHESGWTLVHGMLRESLERLAREAGRWEEINRAASDMLRRCYPDMPRGTQQRLGTHLVQAAEFEAALEPLLKGAWERYYQTEYTQALSLIELREEALEALAVAPDDLRRASGWLLRARILIHQADYRAARKWAERSAEAGRAINDKSLVAESLQLVALTNLWRGQLVPAAELFGRALALFRQSRDRKGTARTLFHLGSTTQQQGDIARASSFFEEALELSSQVADWENWSDCLRKLAMVALKQAELERSETLNRQAMEYYLQQGNRYGVAGCLNTQGNLYLSRGDLKQAEQAYRQVLSLLNSLGVYGELIGAQLNLCLIWLDMGQYEQARRALQEILDGCRQRGVHLYLLASHALALAAVAGLRDFAAWDHHFGQVTEILKETGQVESEVVSALKLAGKLAWEANEQERARCALNMALDGFQRLEDSEGTQEVEQLLGRLSNPR